MDFQQAYRTGRRRVSRFRFGRGGGYLLSLKELLKAVPATGVSYAGIRDVPVARIIGSENRSRDFATGFLPLRQDMRARWESMQQHFLAGRIPDALELIEYGGCYFVRDGNHRVSVARTNGIEFVTARIQSMKTPVKLPEKMSRQRIPLFRAKAEFQARTAVFDHIPEESFSVAIPENWCFLEKDIFEYHRNWYLRNRVPLPDKAGLLARWNSYIYQTAMAFIRQNHLPILFTRKEATDIFCDLLRLWNSSPDIDSLWIMEVYDLYLKQVLNRRALLRPFRFLKKGWEFLFMTRQEARDAFLSLSHFPEILPGAFLPEGGKGWYRFLSEYLLIESCRHLKKKMQRELGRLPGMNEVLTRSFHLLLRPAYEVYTRAGLSRPFPPLFIRWMKRIGSRFLKDATESSPERTAASFRSFLKKTRRFPQHYG